MVRIYNQILIKFVFIYTIPITIYNMLTPKKNICCADQLYSPNFCTPNKQQVSRSKCYSAKTNDVSPNSQNQIGSFKLLGLKNPWQLTPKRGSPGSCKEQITDRYIPARKLFSEQSLSLHSIELEDMEVENQEMENVIPFAQWNDQTQNTKDYTHYLSNIYSHNKRTQETVESFSNKNFLKYSTPSSLNSDDLFGVQHKLLPIKTFNQQNKTIRKKIQKVPYRILDAPNLEDDYYYNLLEWSEFCNTIAVGLSNKVYLWDAHKQSVHKLCDANNTDFQNSVVCSVSWARNAPFLAVGASNGNIDIYDVQKGKKIKQLGSHTQRVSSLSWNNQFILSSGSRDKNICHSDIRQNQHYFYQKSYGHKQQVCGLKWSPDSQKLCSGGNDNKLMIWDINNLVNPVIKYNDHKAAVKALAWSPHQHGLLISGGGTADRTIRFRNTLTGQTLKILETGSQVCNLIFSKTDNQFVSTHGYSMNEIALWSYPKIRKLASIKNHHSSRVLYLTLSPDGETIVTGAGDETLRFWRFFPQTKNSKLTAQNQNKEQLQLKHVSIR